MAIRTTVLYETGGNLRIMSAAQLDEVRHLAAYFYQENPVETLTYVASGGNLSPTMTDRRYQAGTAVFNGTTSFASETDTPDISAIDTTFDHISKTRITATSATEPVENGTGTAFPIYWDGATKTIKAMTKQDFFDTFIGYTITNGLVGTGGVNKLASGTYTVLTNNASISGNPGTTIVSASPIFIDTRADASLYTANGIEEAQDQPETVNSYYLHRIEQSSKPTYQMPLFLLADGSGVQVYTTATFETMVDEYIQSASFGLTGYSITHEMGTSVANQKGTNVNDTYLSGSSADGYTQYLATIDDYRTQEFPNGAVAILNSYKLGVTTAASYTASADVTSVNEGGTITFTITTANVAPGSISYTITGIDAGDISAGALTGNITTTGSAASASGTTQITLTNDSSTEGTETATFTAGGSSVSVTINDTSTNSFEIVSLEGTSASPEATQSFPFTDGSIFAGWRFKTDGTVEEYDSDASPQYVSTNHLPWINTTTPSKTYYLRFSVADQSASGSQTIPAAIPIPGQWYALTSSRTMRFADNRPPASYGSSYVKWKVEISESASGSDQVTGPTHSLSSPQTRWITSLVAVNNWKYTVYWNNVLVYEQDGYAGENTDTEITGSDGYTYRRASVPTQGRSYAVTQTIPGILATGYYQNNYEGGA